ncbi:MAG: ComEA family DNA-binding protein, partial [Actinomycetota bacterium]|nr:ComEA family DNA-binding protein [Actinomycetota bacterium]
VTVIALLAAALATAGAWWVLSGRPQEQAAVSPPLVRVPAEQTARSAPDMPDADPASEPVGMPASTRAATGDPAAGSTSSAEVVVDVTGRVRRPGLVTLDAGARVADAVQSAGGALPKVDLSSINLARPLVDGEQLLVGVRAATVAGAPPATGPGPGTPSSATGSAAPLVNLNAATLEQLDTLPGIGPVTGQSILDWRTDNGAFSSVDELLEVDGIGDVTLADLRDLVTVGPGAQ